MLGVHSSLGGNYFDTVLAAAQASEAAGLDAVFYSDHFQYQRDSLGRRAVKKAAALLRQRTGLRSLPGWLDAWLSWDARRACSDPLRTLTVLECFTTLGAIAAATQRIRLGALVAGVPFRNPALLAKINITLDIISHGRCIVGLGAGWYEEEFKAYGWPFPSARQRMDGLEDALQIINAMLTCSYASYSGRRYQVSNALNNPLPVQKPRPPILIGGSGERRTLQLVARYGDYCNLLGDPLTVARKLAVLKRHCQAVGRPYEAIVPSNFVSILIARSRAELARKRKLYPSWAGYPIIGTPDQVLAGLQAFVNVGIRYIIFNLPDAHTLEPIDLLAETVIPALAGDKNPGEQDKGSLNP